MKEQIVSFETAKLAKEKGFNIQCINYYFEDGEFRENTLTGTNGYYGDEYLFTFDEFLENWNNKWLTKKNGDRCFGCNKTEGYFETYSAPSQSLLQKWLREKHNLYVIVDTIHTLIGTEVIRVEWKWSITSDKDDDIKCIWNGKETYEQALEAGLQEALKLIP